LFPEHQNLGIDPETMRVPLSHMHASSNIIFGRSRVIGYNAHLIPQECGKQLVMNREAMQLG